MTMRMHSLPRLTLCGLVALGLAGCATTGGAAREAGTAAGDAATQQAVTAASGPLDRVMQTIGLAPKPAPTVVAPRVPLRIFTAPNLNAGAGSKPLALVVKVYQLKSLDHFRQTPFDTFLDADKARAALGSDFVDGREMLVLPDQHYASTEQLSPEVRYLAFVALFRGPAADRWRFVYDVKRSTGTGITLGVHACAMSSTAGALVTELADDPASLVSVHCPRIKP